MKTVIPALLGIVMLPLAALGQVTHAPTTGPEPHVVSLDDGASRVLPDGREVLLKVGPKSTGSGYLFLGSEDIPQGAEIPRHRHEIDEEILIIHRGEVIVELDDVAHRAQAGSVIYLPPGTWIALRNEASETATIMFVFPRGSVERCFEFVGRAPDEEGRELTEEEREEEMYSCQMTYAPGPDR